MHWRHRASVGGIVTSLVLSSCALAAVLTSDVIITFILSYPATKSRILYRTVARYSLGSYVGGGYVTPRVTIHARDT